MVRENARLHVNNEGTKSIIRFDQVTLNPRTYISPVHSVVDAVVCHCTAFGIKVYVMWRP